VICDTGYGRGYGRRKGRRKMGRGQTTIPIFRKFVILGTGEDLIIL